MLIERPATDPPPDPSPRRDSPWWRIGGAVSLIVVLGAAAWVISDRSDARTDAGAPIAVGSLGAEPQPDASAVDEEPAAPGPNANEIVPEDSFEFFFEPGEVPPELEEFLNENGLDEFFGPGGLFEGDPRELRDFFFGPNSEFDGDRGQLREFFFGPDGPFGDLPEPGESFRLQPGDGESFGFSFEGELPDALAELLDRLPAELFRGDPETIEEIEGLVDELLADPELPADVREFVERLAARLGLDEGSEG